MGSALYYYTMGLLTTLLLFGIGGAFVYSLWGWRPPKK